MPTSARQCHRSLRAAGSHSGSRALACHQWRWWWLARVGAHKTAQPAETWRGRGGVVMMLLCKCDGNVALTCACVCARTHRCAPRGALAPAQSHLRERVDVRRVGCECAPAVRAHRCAAARVWAGMPARQHRVCAPRHRPTRIGSTRRLACAWGDAGPCRCARREDAGGGRRSGGGRRAKGLRSMVMRQ